MEMDSDIEIIFADGGIEISDSELVRFVEQWVPPVNSRCYAPKDINVNATNMDKYLGFEIEGLRFVDSLQFLNCSLDTLVKNSIRMTTNSNCCFGKGSIHTNTWIVQREWTRCIYHHRIGFSVV